MSDLNDKQIAALQKLCTDSMYRNWLYHEQFNTALDGRTANALLRRGLIQEAVGGYSLTDKGHNYCVETLKLAKPYTVSEYVTSDAIAQQNLEKWAREKPDFNPQEWVSYWQTRAQRLHDVATDYAVYGGAILDRDALRDADVYRAIVNIVSSWSLN